jgi:glutamate-5-semialdehyde dehydrogenase
MDINNVVIEKAKNVKNAARSMSSIGAKIKNKALNYMADALEKNMQEIINANEIDMENGRKKGLSQSLLDRLLLGEDRIKGMAAGLRDVCKLGDPIGEEIRGFEKENGLEISQIRVPLGVIGIIYEARPNVTVDATALCVKSGNAVILRGGSEALTSNVCIANILYNAGIKAGLPEGFLQFLDFTDREGINVLLKLNQYIDVIIPRGGAGLINTVVQNSTVPVIETGIGNCHVFVDYSADFDKAINIITNAKTQRPGVCNAMETLLVHENIAEQFLPMLYKKLSSMGVKFMGCEKTRAIIESGQATEKDWSEEYLDLVLAVKVVKDIDEALEHIYRYGTKHSEAIITENYTNSQRFLKEVDAAAVYVNASTRFTDGSEFGFGAEIGISTQKLHARGPMGLKELTTTKYIIRGNGQIR